jgi:hypothetical protein
MTIFGKRPDRPCFNFTRPAQTVKTLFETAGINS